MGNVKNEVQKIVVLQFSMIFDLFCVFLLMHIKQREHLQFLLGAL